MLKICKSALTEQGSSFTNLSAAEIEAYNALKARVCSMSKKSNYTGSSCRGQRVQVPGAKFKPNINVIFSKDETLDHVKLCRVRKAAMRYDSDFVKAVYLGIDLPFRYVIPCCVLVFLNISLVVSVFKAQRCHSDISGSPNKSLLELPVLRSAVGIVFVFLLCHTGGAGIFVSDVFRVFAEATDGLLGTTVKLFIDEHLATTGLEMKYSGILLAAVNSSVNIVLYCLFLPSFRHHWASPFSMFNWMRERNGRGEDPIQHMEGIALPTLIAVSQSRRGGGVSFFSVTGSFKLEKRICREKTRSAHFPQTLGVTLQVLLEARAKRARKGSCTRGRDGTVNPWGESTRGKGGEAALRVS